MKLGAYKVQAAPSLGHDKNIEKRQNLRYELITGKDDIIITLLQGRCLVIQGYFCPVYGSAGMQVLERTKEVVATHFFTAN